MLTLQSITALAILAIAIFGNHGASAAVEAMCKSTGTAPPMRKLNHQEQKLANGKTLVTGTYAEPANPQRVRPAGTYKADAQKVISYWLNGKPSDNSKGSSTLQSNGAIRLDKQTTTNTVNYGSFDNYQLQINGANLKLPTSVSQVVIKSNLQGFDTKGWRSKLAGALDDSLKAGAIVWVFQQEVDLKKENVVCPRRTGQ